MTEFSPTIEQQENKPKFKELLAKYVGGDSHVHSISSNIDIRHEADYSFEQIAQYIREVIDKGTGQAQFVIMTDHSSDTGNPTTVGGDGMIERQQLIHEFNEQGEDGPKIISGIEANVIGKNGELDLSDELASQMDFVMGAIHGLKPIFPEKENPPAPNAQELSDIFMGLADNPNVDVIGHINRNIPLETLLAMDWDSLLSAAKETKTALEINLRAPMPNWLVEKAVKAGVPIFIGSDIHTLAQFQKLPEEAKAEIECPDDRLQYGPGFKYWWKIARVLKTIDSAGARPGQVITSSLECLNNWISKEKKDRVLDWEENAET